MTRALLDQPVFLLLFALLLSFGTLRRFTVARLFLQPGIAAVCGAVSVFVFVALGILNLARSGFLWHDEASILSVAAAYVHGEPVYHARATPALYSLLYGPSTFLAYVQPLKSSTDPINSIRWLGLAVNLANLLLLYAILRRKTSWPIALGLLPVAIAVLLPSASSLFGIRGDAMLLLCFCIALALAPRTQSFAVAVVCGVAAGIALDFKLTVVPPVCLLLLIVYQRSGRKAALLCAMATVITAASLFFLPQVSFRNYIGWLVLSRRQGLMSGLLSDNIMAALFMVAPGVLLHFSRIGTRLVDRSQKAAASLFTLALVAAILTGSKNGAGPWHLWPLLPFAMLWASEEAQQLRTRTIELSTSSPMLASIAIAAALVALRSGYRDFRSVHPQSVVAGRADQQGAEAELHDLVRRYPGQNIAMGYGRDASDYRSSLRFELPLAGEDYFLDENALVELIKTGAALPPGLTDRVLGCHDLWLVPHAEEPFQTRRNGVLPAGDAEYLFPDAIRLRFVTAHALQSSGRYYDLWRCPYGKGKG